MSTQPAPLPPTAQFMQMMFGKHITYSLSAMAQLGVADYMDSTPVSSGDLASKVDAHGPSLYRVMRLLASVGVFREEPRGYFTLTPVGELLRTDAPQSMRYTAMHFGDTLGTRPFEHFVECVRTGSNAVTMAWGKSAFELFQEMPEDAETFHRAMTNVSRSETETLLQAYDFSGIRRLADVGGGHGALLNAILARYPEMRGVLFDLPDAVAGLETGQFGAYADRMEIEAGSFFERVPAGCDSYLLKHIIHDWDDERCRRILGLIAGVLPKGGRVLVCESVVSEKPVPEMAKMLDIQMLVMTEGGKERTEQEFRELFSSAGLRLERVVRTQQGLCVLEAGEGRGR